jgi:hypothetical protein
MGTFPTKQGSYHFWTDFGATPESYIANDELNTSMAKRLAQFEVDPCGMNEDPPRGMCARPGICVCKCDKYIGVDYNGDGIADASEPWSDTWFRRPWLTPPGYVSGTEACISGWEGHKNQENQFVSCHLKIYEPTWYEKETHWLILATIVTVVVGFGSWIVLRRKIKRKIQLMKQERRRSRRSSEMSSQGNQGAFKS